MFCPVHGTHVWKDRHTLQHACVMVRLYNWQEPQEFQKGTTYIGLNMHSTSSHGPFAVTIQRFGLHAKALYLKLLDLTQYSQGMHSSQQATVSAGAVCRRSFLGCCLRRL